MFETIFIFIMECVWAFICIMFLIGPLVLLFWFVVGMVQFFRQTWKTGKDDTNYRFPPW